ncbi:MAG TPA: EamA family transporter [Jatrophihabitantaceae bacterium]|nr:EamA family transporter [Jatrophihabitantaceae bacterium]
MTVVSASLRARSGVFAISGGAILWGTTGVVAHAVHARTGLSAVSIAFYRTFTAALVLAVVRGPAIARLIRTARRGRLGVLVLAGASLGVSQALYFVAAADAGVSLATLICIGVAPIAVTSASALARRRRPTVGALATLGCALVGLVLITTSTSSATGPHPLAGVLAALGSGLAYVASTVLSGRLAGTADALTLTGATSIVGSLTLAPAALVSGVGFPVDDVSVAALFYLGVVTTVLAYGLFFGGLRTTSAEVAAVLTLLEPLGATVLAVVLLGETLTPLGLLGAVLLLAAVAALLARRPETPVESGAPLAPY